MDVLVTVCGHVRWCLCFPRLSPNGFCPYWSPARRCYASSGCSQFAGMYVCFIHFIHILLWKGHSLVTGGFFHITAFKSGFVSFALHISLALYMGTFSLVWFSCTFSSLGLQVSSSWMSIVLCSLTPLLVHPTALLFYSEIV